MMSSVQPGSTAPPQPRLHRPFPFFDLEAVAVVAILLGVFQVLMTVPLYYLDSGLPRLYILPLCVGIMGDGTFGNMEMGIWCVVQSLWLQLSSFTAAGSFAVACEKSPSKELLKGCAYTNLAGLVGALCALCVYSLCVHSPPTYEPCIGDEYYSYYYSTSCPGELMSNFFQTVSALLLVYDMAALILHALLSFSALKGLKTT